MSATKSTWHGIVLVGGGAIGAGMFALPMVHGFLGHCRFFIGMEYDLAHGKFAGKSKSGSGIRAWYWYQSLAMVLKPPAVLIR